jgi:hypothetical protein
VVVMTEATAEAMVVVMTEATAEAMADHMGKNVEKLKHAC